ncbi:MAG: tetratricopeptide repeat protein [Chitinispirillaceae bacterium]
MKRKQNIISHLNGAFWLLLFLFSSVSYSDQPDEWRSRENQVLRFGTQWNTIELLNQELLQISDVLKDIRDLQLFPDELTRLENSVMVSIDKQIEKAEKRCFSVKTDLSALKPPFVDAMAILREMVVNEPVEDMFEVLERKDLERIDRMIMVKQSIDSLWSDIDALLFRISDAMGISIAREDSSSDKEEFVQILRTSLGRQSEMICRKINRIKDELVRRSSLAQARKMFLVENRRIREYLSGEMYELARKKSLDFKERYKGRIGLDELNLQLAKVNFFLGAYDEVHRIAEQITEGSKHAEESVLYVLQSLYALEDYERVWKLGSSVNIKNQKRSARNLLLWIIMESGIALGRKVDYSRLASLMLKGESYQIHVMHSLGRSYLISEDTSMAFSVLESACKIRPAGEVDRNALVAVKLTLAELHHEKRAYEEALSLYFSMLKGERDLDRVLTGIAWCYFGMGSDDKGENALKKLINQKPESPFAAEAIYVMAKRFLQKARLEWEKTVFLVSEVQRLSELLEKVEKKIAENSSPEEKFIKASEELRSLIMRLKEESRFDYDQIASLYDRVRKINNLVLHHYSSGSFQEVSFTRKREQLLFSLDSLMIALQEQDGSTISRKTRLREASLNRAEIKSVVNRMKILDTDAMLDRYRWEREYLDWQKSQLRRENRKSVSVELDSILINEERLKKKAYRELTSKIKNAIALGVSSRDEAYFRYHLAELYYSEENDKFSSEYDEYETNLQIYNDLISADKGTQAANRISAPQAPVLSHRKSLSEYRKVVGKSGDSLVTAAAYYSMGWCFNDLSRFDSAYHYMEKVAADYPSSPHAAQAWMYCGENRFENADLEEAIRCYQAVMRYPESEYFDQALYKLAWTQYRLSNPQKAISSFLALVELGDGNKTGALLEKESMDYIAISFSETDIAGDQGLRKTVAFVSKFGDDGKGYSIIGRLAGVYKDQGRYDMAIKSYRKLLEMYPEHPDNPLAESQMLALRERGKSPDETGLMKLKYFEKYHMKSSWSQMQADSTVRQRADSAAAQHLYDAAIGFHQFALQNSDPELYGFAVDAYSKYINSYPDSPIAGECHYNLAELEFSRGNLRSAAEEYIAVSRKYKEGKYRETAAWNAIVASQQLLKQEEETKK